MPISIPFANSTIKIKLYKTGAPQMDYDHFLARRVKAIKTSATINVKSDGSMWRFQEFADVMNKIRPTAGQD